MPPAQILIVDDEQSLVDFLGVLCTGEGFEVTTANSVREARERLAARTPDLVLCDMMMPDGNGLDLLREIRSQDLGPAVILMTAYTSTRSAIEAMKAGAYDYVPKPFDVDELKVVIHRALEKTRLAEENVYLRRELAERYAFKNIIGRSPRMQAIFGLIDRVARTTSTVLVQGESGTGKELIARAIHFSSSRADERFLSINCGAMPESLLESELFGHERGAFTGAVREKRGLFQEAHRGTLFLDEIGEMSLAMQVRLLRALQDKTVRRVGGTNEESVDVRIITATNQDLRGKIASGEFREDLFYRINVIPIQLPALRERRDDIPLLVGHFLRKNCEALGLPPKKVSAEAMRLLESYGWPGNVRELENIVERAVALSASGVITASDLPDELITGQARTGQGIELPDEGLDLEATLDRLRTDLMQQALARTGGVQTQAAELLGVTFRSFRYYAKKAGLTGASEPE
ncbi:MAG: sigma-54-dependent Fis family transcriptional regulator [Thermoanaerobaculia bacterium]|nr:MAG: sigma-54-dependent Fis family transcriptional regulator [Thermoanaerobaculia bacterium]MBZ0100920.1 sigma-54 dependent transcriptional regulator [Thermoanaerobaculia bacterium]